MNKILSISAIMAVLTLPAYAGLDQGGGSVVPTGVGGSTTCDNATLGQSDNNSTANVEADWTANTINIIWHPNNDTGSIINTCTYDGTITLPTQPTKTGYTFNGWLLMTDCDTITNESECSQLTHCAWQAYHGMEGGECLFQSEIRDGDMM